MPFPPLALGCMRAMCTYSRCEFGRLSGLPALLTDWRKRCAHGGDVVRGEAAVQLAAHVVGCTHLGADIVAKRERFFAGRAEASIACRIGHFELHGRNTLCTAAVSAWTFIVMWGAGGEEARSRNAGGRDMLWGQHSRMHFG